MTRTVLALNIKSQLADGSWPLVAQGAFEPFATGSQAAADAGTVNTSAAATTALGLTAQTDLNTTFIADFLSLMNSGVDSFLSLFTNVGGGNVTWSGTTYNFSGTPAAGSVTWTVAEQEATIALFNAAGTALLAAQTAATAAAAGTYASYLWAAALTAIQTAITDFGLIASTATNGIAHSFSNQTFTVGTLQLSGTPSASATVTQAIEEALITLCNTCGTAVLAAVAAVTAAQTAQAALSTATNLVVTDLAAFTGTIPNVVVSADTGAVPHSAAIATALSAISSTFKTTQPA